MIMNLFLHLFFTANIYVHITFLLGSKRNSTKMGRPSLDSTEFRLQVVEEAKASNNNAQVARNHRISPATVRNWRKNEDKLSKIFFMCVFKDYDA